MKIAHINIVFSKGRMDGVEKKLIDEAESMNKQGIDVYLLNREKDIFENNIRYIKIDKLNIYTSFLELYIRIFKYSLIDKLINLSKYDFIILRYGLIDFSAFTFSRKYKNKIITEHHTKELNEIKVQNIKEPFKTIQYFLEKYCAKYFFNNVYGIIGISSDVVNEVKHRINDDKLNSFILSNGIKIPNPQILLTEKDKNINLLFVAAVFQKWHGFERLLNSLKEYRGNQLLVLHIVGELNIIQKAIVSSFKTDNILIIYHGKLNQENLKVLYRTMHIACDSLAMYKIGMIESSTLKSKEYILNYLPFLYSAPDPDFKTIDNYLFDCGNNDSNIDFNAIIMKYNLIKHSELKYEFDKCQKEVLNWDVKILKLHNWIKNEK